MAIEKEKVTISYQQTIEDARKAILEIGKRRIRAFLILLISIFIFFEAFYIWYGFSFGFSTYTYFLLIFFPLFLITMFLLPRIIARKPPFSQLHPFNNQFAISEKGIEAKIGFNTFHLLWSHIKKVQESSSFYYFILPLNITIPLPKQHLALEQERIIRKLLEQNLEKKNLRLRKRTMKEKEAQ